MKSRKLSLDERKMSGIDWKVASFQKLTFNFNVSEYHLRNDETTIYDIEHMFIITHYVVLHKNAGL